MKSTTVYTVCTLLLIIDGTDGLLLSLHKHMTKSSVFSSTDAQLGDGSADKAVDGNKTRNQDVCGCCAATGHSFNTWFRLDLGKHFIIQHLEILGREEPPGPNLYQSFQNMNISLIEENSTTTYQETIQDKIYVVNRNLSPTVVARYVYMQIPQKGHFTLCEISVNGDCVDGRFGDDCNTICHCKNGTCNKTTGICPAGGCKSGYHGDSCSTECEQGSYGQNCSNACGMCINNETCNHIDGTCTDCAPGYLTDHCNQTCKPGYFGSNCSERCGECRNGSHCHFIDGVCVNGCDRGYRTLTCKQGCDNGTFGYNCNTTCGSCKDDEICNKTHGTCMLGCKAGYKPDTCLEECNDGTFGENCASTCGTCLNNSPCNKSTGLCDEGCGEGYNGTFCNNTCPAGTYGLDCNETCSEHCANGTVCDFKTGNCGLGCGPGYTSGDCKTECDNGTFGYNCNTTCGSCKDDEICNKTNGTCPLGCKPGYKPDTCLEECNDGTFGENCTSTCGTCLNNSPCNKTTGLCDEGCGEGYNGTFCNNACPNGTYGLDCNEICSEHCANGTVCDFKTGYCGLEGCGPGYTSEDCKTECGDQSYGKNCMETCGRCTSGICNKTNGYCDACLDGLVLPLCKALPVIIIDEEDPSIGPVIGGVVGGAVVLALMSILLLVFIRRRRNKSNGKPPNKPFSTVLGNSPEAQLEGSIGPQKQPNNQNGIQHPSESNMEEQTTTKRHLQIQNSMKTKSKGKTPADKEPKQTLNQNGVSASDSNLRICKIWDYINEMKKNSNLFYQEFGLLKKELLHPHKVADQNRPKNRYKGICSYDYNRVPLNVDTQDESGYINASFINGFEKGKKFIASQGPVPEMVKDFWRMIWQYNCEQIVMLTNLVERGTDKCMQYWAEEEDITFGTITIKPGRVETTTDYDVRHLTFCKNNEPAKFVTQYHFKSWPDKDVPDSTWSLVKFWLRVTKDTIVKKDSPPVVVHCSAGVGRTGTYIALDYLYNQGNIEGQLRPFQAVKDLRDQRPSMVQTKEQYVFLHEAVADTLLFGTHFIWLNQIQDVYNYLFQDDPATKMSRMCMQFQLIVDSVEDLYRAENEGVYANETEYSNVNLKTPSGNGDRTQKLGAVFIKDFKGKESLIVAATPTSTTMETFWSLVSENNVSTVVIVAEPASPNYKELLPKPKNGSKDQIQVSILGEKASGCYIDRQFQYTGKDADKVPVRLIEYTNWTDSRDVPGDRQSMIALLDHVLECQDRCFDKEPILILCTTGHLKSGVVCALLNEFYRIQNDGGHINIVETVKMLKEKHRFAVPKFEQYKYIYDVILSKVCGDQIYENV